VVLSGRRPSSLDVAAGYYFGCARTEKGSITCWGSDQYGQTEASKFLTVSAGGGHSCGLRADNSVVCWGNNDKGQTNPQPP
jgi:alpha-tubulin suppressor-like RCC1 family protein